VNGRFERLLTERRDNLRAKAMGAHAQLQRPLPGAERTRLNEVRAAARRELGAVTALLRRAQRVCDDCGCLVPAAGPCPVCAAEVSP
jgi:rubrerythrin